MSCLVTYLRGETRSKPEATLSWICRLKPRAQARVQPRPSELPTTDYQERDI